MTLGQRIKAARKQQGLKQTELAEMVGISVNSLRLYEGDKINPKSDVLNKIALACHVSISYLSGDIDEFGFTLFGDAIERYSKSQGISRLELAQKLNMSESDLLGCETGNKLYSKKLIDTVPPLLGFASYDDMMQQYLTSPTDYAIKQEKKRYKIIAECKQTLQELENEQKLIRVFHNLNSLGKVVAVQRIEELSKIPEYRKDSSDSDAVPDSDKKTPAGE